MQRPFLTARWTNLLVITYSVPPRVLASSLPPGLALDTYDGQAFVSLVAFEFLDARFWGVAWPGLRDFPELNLRYYVKRGEERGVVFVREYVPVRPVAWVANWIYHEHYRVAAMRYSIDDDPSGRSAQLQLVSGGRTNTLRARGNKPAVMPAIGTPEHIFAELRWGFGANRQGRLEQFEVNHPSWPLLPVESVEVDLDWNAVYGSEWKFLQDQQPHSTAFALGSEVAMYSKRVVRERQ